MDAVYCNFLSQPLSVRTGQCAHLLPSLEAATVSQAHRERLVATSDQQFIMSHHEHTRKKKKSACLCGVCAVLCCCIVVLYVTWCVSACCCVCVWCPKPIERIMGGFYKQPVHITTSYEKKQLLRYFVSIRKPGVWNCSLARTPV